MASLLERISGAPTATGPIRSKASNGSRTSSPYTRNAKLPKGDPDGTWTHDLYESHNSLSARISGAPTPPKPVLNNIAQKALKEATATLKSTESLSIKGASQGNVVEVKGLAPGTTAEDVAAIFKQCGPIVDQKLVEGGNNVRVRIHFKTAQAATSAIAKFNNQPADGKILSVVIVGASTAGHSLASRIGKGGLGLVRQEGSVDVLMDTDPASSSKLRSDALLATDPRAQVLVAPPGTNPSDYVQGADSGRGTRRGGGRGGRGRRGGRGGKRGGNKMDTD